MSHPIFAICVMNIGGEKYKIYVKEIQDKSVPDMIKKYAQFLKKLILTYPKQWFNFFDFFVSGQD